MNKIAIGVILMSMIAVGYAQKINLGVWGGYATVSMNDVNEELDKFASSFPQQVLTPEVTKLGSGLIFGVDVGYEVSGGILVGPRIGYLSCSQGSVSGEITQGGYFYKFQTTIDASMIPIMIGGAYTKEVAENLLLSGKLYVGYGLANIKSGFKTETNAPGATTESFEIPYEGSGLVVDIGATGEYKIAENISLGLNLGYRIANISEIKASKDVPEAGVKKGDVIKDSEGNPVAVDYSGLTVGLGINFKF